MEFGSRTKRGVFLGILLGLVPDAVLAAVLAAFFSGGAAGFFIILIGLQVASLVLWIKQSLWAWTLFTCGGRKRTAAALLDGLVSQGFPEPGDYHPSADSYFSAIADDASASVPLRLAAMSNATLFALMGQEGRFQDGLRLSMVYEDALIGLKRARHLSAGASR